MDKIKTALNQLGRGGMIIVVDDQNRENEGDLIAAADLITPQQINFMITHGRGLVCLALPGTRIDKLQLPLLQRTAVDHDHHGTAFTFSLDAKNGITTGISAYDRTHTIKLAMQPNVNPDNFVVPGHIFPLRAKERGVLERRGHTEAAVDLTRLAGLEPGGVICEILNDDGTMMRLPELEIFAEKHQLPLISIEDLVALRERLEITQAEAKLPTKWGDFNVCIYKDIDDHDNVVLWHGDFKKVPSPLIRIHSECLTGDVFGSKKCDCGDQLEESIQQIATEPAGMIIYLRQEGRGIGLAQKIKAYALQEQGLDTVEANHVLGYPTDNRRYDLAIRILTDFGINRVRLLSNNPAKIQAFTHSHITCERVALVIPPCPENTLYQQTKIQKLGHILNEY
ncbi:bifunctional 3,4-dihydroxy-2-butanone-4-phosphate synthase/GTP cyclohydrolase II [Candidatus Paracaedibacter symbiosus]|uniref:bifunctional 3,4-dihydroxy-2-butanone-4-phosphate synthase/GTP cyclohydrolase II n=1 Tax=Candidatus Paracaedibacter symbiosus TaxID=244582 RepID=UPI0005093EF0|nr:bifunctional 3,4-dihydroxy-2-butanone-4-phosphate synthase/GTP cyclohydrolase II [Candidatus Paracaedibacter symbiosus]